MKIGQKAFNILNKIYEPCNVGRNDFRVLRGHLSCQSGQKNPKMKKNPTTIFSKFIRSQCQTDLQVV